MELTIEKKVNLNLVGVNGSAFSIIGVFSKQAREEGWTDDEISEVTNEAMSSDYQHLLATILNFCDDTQGE